MIDTKAAKKVLILHHVEPMWNDSLISKGGVSFDELQKNLAEHLEENKYDKVIVTRFEEFKCEQETYYALYPYIDECETYGYGWDIESCFYIDDEDTDDTTLALEAIKERLENGDIVRNKYGTRFVNGGNHCEIVEIPDFLDDIKTADVYLAGAFDGECIEDMEIAMQALKIDFTRLEQFIV